MSAHREKLQDIFRDIFDDDDIVLEDHMTAADIAGWDSLKNVRLMVRVETTFGFKFSTREVVELKNIGGLLELIAKKLGAK